MFTSSVDDLTVQPDRAAGKTPRKDDVESMTTFTLFTYAWDIEDIGIAAFADEVRSLGLSHISLAGAYHAGKFLRPHGKKGKVYFPEDGTVYFRHRDERYGRITPERWSKLDEFDPFAELATAAPDLKRNAWIVCCHNSRIGMAHPELVAHNCFDDRYIYSLNPAHPDVRDFVVGLCRDIAEQHDLEALTLETPGWLPYVHGYHHEFAMRPVDPWLATSLGICFAPASVESARKEGIDAGALKARLRASIETHLEQGLHLDDARASQWIMADLVGDPDWAAYHRWRQKTVTELVAEIRDAVPRSTAIRVIPSVRRPTAQCFWEGSDLASLAGTADAIEICAYEPDANAVALDVQDVRRRIGDASLHAVIRPSFPDLASGADTAAAARHLKAAGIKGLGFYNYGHMDRPSLARIKQAIEVFQ
jgi:hypothetical protein